MLPASTFVRNAKAPIPRQAPWHTEVNSLLRRSASAAAVLGPSDEDKGAAVSRSELESWVQELGIQAEFEDPLEEDEDDIDDLLEETEDPWMREPAGLEFAGELIELPELEGADATADASQLQATNRSAWTDEVQWCTLSDAAQSAAIGTGCIIAISDPSVATGVDLPECKYIPLADLTQDRYERDLKVWDSLHILCPELVQSSPDASTLDGNSEGSSISQDSSLEGPSVAQDLKGSRSEGRGKAEIEQGLGPWAEGKQALIRLQKVMGHEQVFLIR